MFVNNISPEILQIGPFTIRFYGIVYALGFIIVAYFLSKKEGKIKNLDKEKAFDIVVWGMVAGIIGARLYHVISDFHLYKNNIIGVFEIWKGGLAFYGGLTAGLLAVYIYCRKHRIDFSQVMDNIAIPSIFMVGMGRIANYINSEHLGWPSNLPWCVIYARIDDVCRHPSQIYEAISMFVLFLALLLVAKKTKKKSSVFISALIGYGIVRFFTDFFRIHNAYFIGLSHSQWISIMMVALSLLYIKLKRKKR